MGRHIPEDIVMIILVGLPVKSLLQLKSVCKNWYHLIDSRNFAVKHYEYQYRNNRGRLLLHFQDEYHVDHILLDSETLGSSTNEGFEKVHINNKSDFFQQQKKRNKLQRWFLCGPVKGLCCITNAGCDIIIIWNPATKEYLELPLPSKPELLRIRCLSSILLIGFGLDHMTDDCKLVLKPFNKDIYVYSLLMNTWKRLDTKVPDQILCVTEAVGVHLDGVCYWFYRGKMKIATFDMNKEIFGLIEIRPSCNSCLPMLERESAGSLMVRDNRLLLVYPTLYDLFTLCAHTSKVDKDGICIQQLFRETTHCFRFDAVELRNCKEVIFFVRDRKFQWCLYNIVTKETVKELGHNFWAWQNYIYYESLESVKGKKLRQ